MMITMQHLTLCRTVGTLDLAIKVYEAKGGMRKHLLHVVGINFFCINYKSKLLEYTIESCTTLSPGEPDYD